MNYETAKKEFIKKLERASSSHSTYNVFTDWLQLGALSLAQVGDFCEKREKRYLEIIKKYDTETQKIFPELLALTTEAFSDKFGDFLGEIYMSCGFGSSNQGQFFTPYNVCKLMAQVQGIPEENKIVRVMDCAVGGGALIIAYAEHLKDNNFNFQNYMLADVTDVSINSCCMSMIQFSLLGIPAIVRHGNSLTLDLWEVWTTPMTKMNLILQRLKIQESETKPEAQSPVETKIIAPESARATQEIDIKSEKGQFLLF